MVNKTKDRTMSHIIVLLVCAIFFWGFYVSVKHEQITTEQTQKQQTVNEIMSLVKDNDILIKNKSLTILFDGTIEELKQEQQYLNKEVSEIAVCDDDEDTITIFIK